MKSVLGKDVIVKLDGEVIDFISMTIDKPTFKLPFPDPYITLETKDDIVYDDGERVEVIMNLGD